MTRPYTLGARASAVEARKQRIAEAAYAQMGRMPYEEVTLQDIATEAGVGLRTVLRLFGTKEALALDALRRIGPAREEARRAVEVGDVEGAVAVLVERYEAAATTVVRNVALEHRLPLLQEAVTRARTSHLGWLGRAFAPWLPEEGPEREVRLLALFGATEIYTWWAWRHRLGATRATAHAALLATVEALVARWSVPPSTPRSP